MIDLIQELIEDISSLDNPDMRIDAINKVKIALHDISPFYDEPVDLVLWVKAGEVIANDYNPNTVAPPEMLLLETSIIEDGYTQPIVAWKKEDEHEVVDGFHRNRVGKESPAVSKRIHGYLPIVDINKGREDKASRMASTIRHNRARGKHRVDAMSEIVLELKNRNWKNERIAKQLGMDEDEILRLCQITGLAHLFSDDDFSRSWDVDKSSPDDIEFQESDEFIVDDAFITEADAKTRTVNTSDKNRIFHTYDKWECEKAGFYNSTMEGMSKKECEDAYAEFLSDTEKFSLALSGVISKWKHSCEHYLTNASLNRIAWLGQAAMCFSTGVPSEFRAGFTLMTESQQDEANKTALVYLNIWLENHGLKPVDLDGALTGRQSTLY